MVYLHIEIRCTVYTTFNLPFLLCYLSCSSFFTQIHVLQQQVLQNTGPLNTYLFRSAYSVVLLFVIVTLPLKASSCQKSLLYSLTLPHKFKKQLCLAESVLGRYACSINSYKERQYLVTYLSNKKLWSSNSCPFYHVTEHGVLPYRNLASAGTSHNYSTNTWGVWLCLPHECYCEVVDRTYASVGIAASYNFDKT